MRFQALTAVLPLLFAVGSAIPPGVPSPSEAFAQLRELLVAPSQPGLGYARTKFPHWDNITNVCNTRETVLKRDGLNVKLDSQCRAVSGIWYSPYDGQTWQAASDVDVDHMVPLKNAWISGAQSWTTAQRELFANDLVRPQLWSVTDNVNQAKGDKSPDVWKPNVTDFYCTYAGSWVTVKSFYNLTVTKDEKKALAKMLATCPDEEL